MGNPLLTLLAASYRDPTDSSIFKDYMVFLPTRSVTRSLLSADRLRLRVLLGSFSFVALVSIYRIKSETIKERNRTSLQGFKRQWHTPEYVHAQVPSVFDRIE